MDVFEDLKELLGCYYISDMARQYNKEARNVVKGMDLRQYPLSQLRDLYSYLYKKDLEFADYLEAEQAFTTYSSSPATPFDFPQPL